MGKWRWGVLIALLLGLSQGGSVQAGPIYTLRFEQSEYTVDAGDTVAVRVFLREDVSDGSTSLLKNTGLIGAGVQINWNNELAAVASSSAILPNLGVGGFLDNVNTSSTSQSATFLAAGSASLTENIGLRPDPVLATGTGPLYDIFLGTFRFTAGALGGDTTLTGTRRTLGVPVGSSSQDLVGADFPPTVLDDVVLTGTATIHVITPVHAVPQPASLMLLATASASLLGYGYCRRRRTSAVSRPSSEDSRKPGEGATRGR